MSVILFWMRALQISPDGVLLWWPIMETKFRAICSKSGKLEMKGGPSVSWCCSSMTSQSSANGPSLSSTNLSSLSDGFKMVIPSSFWEVYSESAVARLPDFETRMGDRKVKFSKLHPVG